MSRQQKKNSPWPEDFNQWATAFAYLIVVVGTLYVLRELSGY